MAGGVVEKCRPMFLGEECFYNPLLLNYSGSCTKSAFKKGVHCALETPNSLVKTLVNQLDLL